ncbi:MAG: hypothetical protein PVH12_05740 [Candidatus Bathyarchaeota archaeon]|jgi:hypothetical protein
MAVSALLGGIALTAYANENDEGNSNGFPERVNRRMMMEICRMPRERPHGWRYHGFIEVSEEFEENAINIAKSDQDVQNLVDDGYNFTRVRPIIKTIVEADGEVDTKATSAIVILAKDSTSHASVWVDLEEGKVTEIVILTRTVIEKP